MPKRVEVYGVNVDVLDDEPGYYVCHPTERKAGYFTEADNCDQCCLAVMPDRGDIVILWGCGNKTNWSVNRDDPGWAKKVERLWALSTGAT